MPPRTAHFTTSGDEEEGINAEDAMVFLPMLYSKQWLYGKTSSLGIYDGLETIPLLHLARRPAWLEKELGGGVLNKEDRI